MLSIAPTTEIEAFSTDAPSEHCIGSVCMVTRDHITAATMMAWQHTDWAFIPPGKYVERNIVQGNVLPLQRNECVQRMKGDWLLFIDDDMVWSPKDIEKLLAAREEIDADIIGGLCFQRSAPHNPTMFMRESPKAGGYQFLEKWTDDIVEVDATGMAFVVIHKRVFEKMIGRPMPPYEMRMGYLPLPFFRWEGTLGEDLRFCQDAKSAGVRIFVDTRIEIGHVSEVEIRRRHFLLEALARKPEVVKARKEINDRMGLPTLTDKEIAEALELGWR